MNIFDYLKSWPLYFLPHHLLSRLVFRLTRLRSKHVPAVIRWFVRTFDVNLAEAKLDRPEDYESFNAFFTRELKTGLRPVAEGDAVMVSPVDGAISQFGDITDGKLIQAKGLNYSLQTLLGGDAVEAERFNAGSFMTIYLSPRDYHRIHMPLSARLLRQIYIPGRLFSVAGHTTRTIPGLFTRNERVVAIFDTDYGRMAMILVGAINVAAIETVWSGLITPPNGRQIKEEDLSHKALTLSKGEEMGRFNMGSTVILLLEKGQLAWENDCCPELPVRLGEVLAKIQ